MTLEDLGITKEEYIKLVQELLEGMSSKTTRIKKVKRKPDYWPNREIKPSPAEVLIRSILKKLGIPYQREVSFRGFKSLGGGYYRYDFYLVRHNTIIEYDGKGFHNDTTNDDIKDEFCRSKGIKMVRFNAENYYHLEDEIKKLI